MQRSLRGGKPRTQGYSDRRNEQKGTEGSISELLLQVREHAILGKVLSRLQLHAPGCVCFGRPGPPGLALPSRSFDLCADKPRQPLGKRVFPEMTDIYHRIEADAGATRYDIERRILEQVQEIARRLGFPRLGEGYRTAGTAAAAPATGHYMDIRIVKCGLLQHPNAAVAMMGREERMVELVRSVMEAVRAHEADAGDPAPAAADPPAAAGRRAAAASTAEAAAGADIVTDSGRHTYVLPIRLNKLFAYLNANLGDQSSQGSSAYDSRTGSGRGDGGSSVRTWNSSHLGPAQGSAATSRRTSVDSSMSGFYSAHGSYDGRSVVEAASFNLDRATIEDRFDDHDRLADVVLEALMECGEQDAVSYFASCDVIADASTVVASTATSDPGSVRALAPRLKIVVGRHLQELLSWMLDGRVNASVSMWPQRVLAAFDLVIEGSSYAGTSASNPGSLSSALASTGAEMADLCVLCVLQHERQVGAETTAYERTPGAIHWELNLPGGKRRPGMGPATAAQMRVRTEARIRHLPLPTDRTGTPAAGDSAASVAAALYSREGASLDEERRSAEADEGALDCPNDVKYLCEAWPIVKRGPQEKLLFVYTVDAYAPDL